MFSITGNISTTSNAKETSCLKLLLAKNPELNVRNKSHGWTALCVAARNSSEAVKLLLDAGADPNLECAAGTHSNSEKRCGATALFFASEQGDDSAVKHLLESGKVLNEDAPRPFDGFTPLIVASKEGHHQVVKLSSATAQIILLLILPETRP